MGTRIKTYTAEGPALQLFVSDCTCGVVFGMPIEFEKRRREDGETFYCPSGHSLVFSQREDTEQKLKDAAARETALRDQLEASIRDGEAQRVDHSRLAHRKTEPETDQPKEGERDD